MNNTDFTDQIHSLVDKIQDIKIKESFIYPILYLYDSKIEELEKIIENKNILIRKQNNALKTIKKEMDYYEE